jgi:hypothetical protein
MLMPFQFSAGFTIFDFEANSLTKLIIALPSDLVKVSEPIKIIGRFAFASFYE